ncbi:MAG: hypothetical protein US58_C0027G0010 [Candidatus Magasanikbacteria bacterium GW2011_GWA2_37_8]|uniref:Uncharacterized protein n=1 Tax=Candidatus Magasanikbacteria bacterium GW2011_GWA2_37_8 TaxID=1619036 RepID=A0A0G0JSA0_9BACT|nr:MAG: hypothetical protein US58_C0027G0010 [Candidatus Magasanikbacteria bacterium GW2011_GWA2_37_8]
MFKHKQTTPPLVEAKTEAEPVAVDKIESTPKNSTADLRELMEKNLKWSQIIYEQNRKINNKLLWSAIAGWLRIFLIVVPIVLAIIYLSPIMKSAFDAYQGLLGGTTNKTGITNINTQSLEQLMNLLPLNAAQREQIKATIK